MKIAIINKCAECPYMDNEYYDYAGDCAKLIRCIQNEKLPNGENFSIYDGIHPDCPLEDAKESK